MALYRFLQPVNSLPDPKGPLSVVVLPSVIKDANKAAEVTLQQSTGPKARGKYAKFTHSRRRSLSTLLCTEIKLQFASIRKN